MRTMHVHRLKPKQILSPFLIVMLLAFEAVVGWPSDVRAQWQPLGALSGGRYVGSKVCAGCHPTESAIQPSTPMALTLSPAAKSEVLGSHPRLSGQLGRYSYLILTEGERSTYTVSDGEHSATPSTWPAVRRVVLSRSVLNPTVWC